MEQAVEEIRQKFIQDLKSSDSAKAAEDLKVFYLGRKGPIQQLMKGLKDVASDLRPQCGKLINDLKQDLTKECDALVEKLQLQEEAVRLESEEVDITLPGRRQFSGRKHPITQMMDVVIEALVEMGFTVQCGPDIESDYYNFEALNFAKDHPARDMQDTFYIAPEVLLRTHTSNVQVRVMETSKPPIRVISPGKCYRNETITARSHVFFHQVEALYVDDHVSFADLMSAMNEFLSKLFARKVETRFRASYFPFVEPGMEVDVGCLLCDAKGCAVCKHTGWLEVAGAGMVHPEVLKNGGIDPEKYSGYAWAVGIERLVMIKHGIKDIRLFTENDMRFLHQFA
ncbi:Phenylalanine--tRNA ligase alpha subunit [Chlamydiales bacterium SCGC AG-110-M15]|nr:Phenylalanine--tRNA ligase alpha subunit [Chlamydiales bacterium SCGC AG-110-M15]